MSVNPSCDKAQLLKDVLELSERGIIFVNSYLKKVIVNTAEGETTYWNNGTIEPFCPPGDEDGRKCQNTPLDEIVVYAKKNGRVSRRLLINWSRSHDE
jgi:hypothetical protein